MTEHTYDRPDYGPPLVEWRAIFSGAVIGLGALALLAALFSALAFAGQQAFVADTFEWWIAGSAIFAIFLGAYLAGVFAGVRGAGAGMVNGVTLWGVTLLILAFVGAPAALQVFGVPAEPLEELPTGMLWSSFFAILIGFAAALFGGALGGMSPRRRYATERVTETRVREEPRRLPREPERGRRTGTEA